MSVSGYSPRSILFDYYRYINHFPFSTADPDNEGINGLTLPPRLPHPLTEELGEIVNFTK